MNIWCHQLFALIFLLDGGNTLKQQSKNLSAPAKNKDHVLHFIVLRHKLMIVLIQTKETVLKNYINFVWTLKRMIDYQVSKINICNNHLLGLKEKTYKDVPNSLKPVSSLPLMTQELFFDPHVEVKTRSQNSLNYTLLGRICEPESGQFITDTERKSISLTFVESPALYFNVSFEKFLLEPHPWCFSEFVLFRRRTKSNPQSPIYIFCGWRHPWDVIYTNNKMKMWIVLRKTTLMKFKFQICNPQEIVTYLICQYAITTQRHPCRNTNFETSLLTHAFTFLVNNNKFKIYVISIVVFKFQKLFIRDSSIFHRIFDGPTLFYKIMPVRNGLVMSSFQATVQVPHLFHLLEKGTTADWYYYGKEFVTKEYTSSVLGSKLVLNKSCHKVKCMVHEAHWLKAPHSIGITVINATYSGPREPVTKHYAGIAIYETEKRIKIEEDESEFEARQILSISPDSSLDHKNFTYVGNPFAKYVAITYYYYGEFSFMKGELSISKTDCVGLHLSRHPVACAKHTHSGDVWLFNDFFEQIRRENIQCAIVIILVSYENKRVFDEENNRHNFKCPTGVLHFFSKVSTNKLQHNADVVWKQLEIYHTNLAYHTVTNYTLIENLQNMISTPPDKEMEGITYPGLYSKNGNIRSLHDMCHPKDIDGYMKVMPEQYSHFILQGGRLSWNNTNMHVRISTATSLNVWHEQDLKLDLIVDVNDMQSSWAKLSFFRFNCSSSVLESPSFPNPYLHLERDRLCKAKKLEYSKWGEAIQNEGFPVLYPVNWTAKATVNHFSIPLSASKVAFVLNDVSDYYRNFAIPYAQIVLKHKKSIYVTLRFTKLASNFPYSYTSKDTNVSVLLPSNQTETLIPTTVLPFCKKETWFSQPCEFTINPRNPSSFKKLNISIQILPPPQVNSTGHYFNLFPVCGNLLVLEHCLNEFVTWEQAHEMCTDMNMTLPAIYSKRDMEEMQKVIDKYQRELSCGKSGNTDILYNTIGIYVGVNFDVSQSFFPLVFSGNTRHLLILFACL